MKKVLSIGTALAVSSTLAYTAEASAEDHTVEKGDTISELAHANNTTADAIKSNNNLDSNIIVPGQVLEINGEESSEKESSQDGNYEIQPGDTLFEIAAEFNVSVSELKEWNNLSSDLIFPGKTIAVTGGNAEQVPAVEAAQVQENEARETAAQEQQQTEQQVQQQQSEDAQPVAPEQNTEQPQTENVSTSSNDSGQNWGALAQCESSGDPNVVSSNGLYHGLYQFDVQTWQSVGGSGVPSDASAAEQTQRAQMLYQDRGAQPWPVCGSNL
ncbi:LysM peptidoglycan-binding domain-containing protein [Salinicoccus albus]|uniref:LysM peptidoglycan-binding domain-containing protein n=1 Tax=Salinicoccus albus TaxID=418756 RepID=UPI00037A6E58|nr:LysM peptidoglycan-binding domain-containing protein [Salinicoccus albus]